MLPVWWKLAIFVILAFFAQNSNGQSALATVYSYDDCDYSYSTRSVIFTNTCTEKVLFTSRTAVTGNGATFGMYVQCSSISTAATWSVFLYEAGTTCGVYAGGNTGSGLTCTTIEVTNYFYASYSGTVTVPVVVDCSTNSISPSRTPTVIPSARPSVVPSIIPTRAPTVFPTAAKVAEVWTQTGCANEAVFVYQLTSGVCSTVTMYVTTGSSSSYDMQVTCTTGSTTSSWTAALYTSESGCTVSNGNLASSGSSCTSINATFFNGDIADVVIPVTINCGYGQPTVLPTRVPTVVPSRLPTYVPTAVPTRPTASPTPRPSQTPTFAPSATPTLTPAAPKITNLTIDTITLSTIKLTATLDSNSRFAGRMYCASLTNGTNITALSQVTSSGFSSSYIANAASVSVAMSSLIPVKTYSVFCAIVTNIGYATPVVNINKEELVITTKCCKSVTFSNKPLFIYADPSQYTTNSKSTTYTFTYSIQAAPNFVNLTVTPLLCFANGSRISSRYLQVDPTSATFSPQSASSLSSSFILLAGSPNFYEDIKIKLKATGNSGDEYYSTTTAAVLVGDIPPAPEISAVTFGDAGKDMYLSFDSKTNLGNQPLLTSWTCNTLLSFTGANYTTCTWLNTSAIQAVFPSAATGVSLIEINNSVTVRGGLIQPYCGTSTTLCGSAFNFTEQSSKAASTAFNPVTPEVVLIVPTLLGSCDALTVNAAQSTGSGGRNWSTIVWQVTTTNDGLNDDAQAIENKLQSYDSISNTLTVSRSLISAGTYIISLTLTNLFGLSSSGSIRFTAQEALIVPIVSIAGSSSISILTSSALTVYGFASFSSCTTVTSTIRLNYNWKLFLDSKQVSLTSRSRTASQYSLSAYSLAVGSTYTLQLNVTVTNGTSPIVLGSSTASASITIASGNVVAVVTGGSYRQVAEDANLTLSGSSSYDQNSESRTLLSYAWSCTILTFGLKFGDDCSGVIRQQSSSVNVIGSKLSSSLSYGIKLTVSSTDGRSGSTTVTVTSISSGSPFTEITTTATRLNYDSNFTVSSVVQASSDVTVTWSVLMDGQNVTISTNSPLTRTILARYVSSNLPLSLSLLPNTFTPNSVVTFRITAATAKKSAYSEISLLVNAAPVGGSLAVTPTSGSALSTFFLLQTSNWVDVNPSDYLLTYVFTYYQISTLPTLTIQARSTLNTVSAQFPPGLMSLSYKITAFVTAYDPYLAASQPASIQFTVTINNNVDVSNYLDTVFTSAVNSGNADTAIQSLNAVSSTVNIVNCSAMSASYCVALNRNPCADVPNTCGSCLSGYRGVIGAFNSLCSSSPSSESSGSGIGAQCATNSNCLYGNCTSYVCVAPDLQCPSSISEAICSGNGDCNYFDFSGAAVNSVCKVTNVTCVARCSCFDGYGGADCSLSSSALTTRDTLRQSLCTGVTSVQGISDDSNLVLTSLATTLQAAYSASEVVTNSSLTTCQSALTSVVSLAVDGYLKDAPPSTAIALVTTTSNFIDSVLNTTSQSASVIDNAVGNIATGLLRAIANDEYPTTIAANNIRLIARRDFIGDLINVSFAPPLTDAEVEYGALGSSLSFTSISNVSECDGGQGYARIAALTYGINPYPNSSNVQSTIFRFSSQHRDTTEGDDKGDQEQTGRRGRYLLETSPTQLANTTGDYLFSLQFFTEQNFDFNMTIDEAERLGKTNFTFPVCRTYDGDEGQYLACSGCNVSTYNNFNVTFLCDDVTQICDANGDSTTANRRGRRLAWENYLNDMTSSATSSSRRLFVDDDNTDDDYTSFNQGFSIQQYAAIIQAAARVFTSTLNPFHINLKEAAPVLSFVTLLAASMILCGIFLYRMDWLEEHELLENQVWPPTVTSAETVSSFWAIAYKRQSNDEILAKRQAKMMKMSMTDDKLGKQQQDRKKKKQAVFVNYQEAISVHAHHILQAIVPTELVDHNFFRFVWCLIQNHDYLGMFSRPSISQRRFIRYSAFCRSLLLTLLVDTLFFSVFFDDGGQCNSYGTKGMCLERQNKATGQAFCLWQPDGQNSPYTGNCSFREPPSNFIFQIVLALLTMLITLPIDLSIGYIFDQYAAKEADWKLIHMDNMHDDGVVSGHPTNEEEEEHTNKDDQLFLAIEEGEGGVDTSPTEKIIMTVQDSNQRNLFKQYSFSHLTNKTDVVHHESVEEELQHLKRKIASHFEQSATLPFGDSGIQFEAWQQHIKARSDALSSYLGILPSGHMRWMTVREFMLYGNHQRRLMSKLKNVRDQEENLLDHLDQIQDVGSAIRASVLINAFVKEQLTGFKRWVLVNKLGCLDGFLVDRVHPYSWIAAWTFVIAVCIFCLYWIFAWGVTVGTTLIRAWGVNFIIATVQDIFFVCIAKCMIFYMIAMRSIRPQLVTIRDYLRQQLALMQMRQLPLRKRLMMNNERGFSVVQTLSPACRAAGNLLQTEETRFSSSADAKMDPKIAILKLLRMIDDYDIVRCREVRSNKLTWIAIFIAFSPIVFVLFGEVMTDLTLDMIMPTISSAFLILNAILNAINPAILAIPYIVLAFVLLYYFGLIPLAKYEHKRWKKRVWNHRDEAISAQLLRPMMSRRKAWQESSFVREMCDLVLEGIAFIVYYTSWRLQRDEHKNRIGGKRRVWRLVNIPSHLKPREEAVRYVATSLHDVVSLDDEEKEHGNSNSKNEDDDIDTSKTNESYDDEEGEEAGSPNRISSFRDIIERESPPPSTAAKKQATQQPLIMLPPEILKLVSGQWAVALDHNVDTNDDIHSNDPLVIAKLKAKKMKRSSLKAAKKIANNIPAPLPSLPSSLLPQPLADALSSSLLSFKIRRSSNALNDVDLAPAPASSPPPVADILPRPRRIKYTEDTPSIINLQQQMIEAFCQHQDPERSDGEVKKLAKEMLANESTKGPADLLPTEYLIDLLSEVLTSTPRVVGLGLSDEQREEVLRNVQQSVVATAAGEEILFADFICLCLCPTLSDMDDLRFDGNEEVEEDDDEEEKADDDEVGEEKKADENERKEEGRFSPRKLATRLSGAVQRIQESLRVGQEEERDVPNIIDIGEQLISRISDSFQQMQQSLSPSPQFSQAPQPLPQVDTEEESAHQAQLMEQEQVVSREGELVAAPAEPEGEEEPKEDLP